MPFIIEALSKKDYGSLVSYQLIPQTGEAFSEKKKRTTFDLIPKGYVGSQGRILVQFFLFEETITLE